jgi:hypothetical protein
LTADFRLVGSITLVRADWYSFSVTNGSTYRLWWNELNNGGTGDGSKTANISVGVWYPDGAATTINNQNDGWSTAASFTANSDTVVYVRVAPTYNSTLGTYGIVYSTGTTRPTVPTP